MNENKVRQCKMCDKIKSYISNGYIFDSIHLFMFFTWLWAWLGLYMIKFIEFIFRMILCLPNRYLELLSNPKIKTSDNNYIHIINSFDEKGNDITNKVKLFLKYYWCKSNSITPYNKNSFNFIKLSDMLNISIMFCSYVLNSNIDIKFKDTIIFDDIKNMILERKDNDTYISYESDKSDIKKVFLDYVNFEEYGKKNYNNEEDNNTIIGEILLSLHR